MLDMLHFGEKKKKKSPLLFLDLLQFNKTGRIKKIRIEPDVMLTA